MLLLHTRLFASPPTYFFRISRTAESRASAERQLMPPSNFHGLDDGLEPWSNRLVTPTVYDKVRWQYDATIVTTEELRWCLAAPKEVLRIYHGWLRIQNGFITSILRRLRYSSTNTPRSLYGY